MKRWSVPRTIAVLLVIFFGTATVSFAATIYVPKLPRKTVGTAYPTLSEAVTNATPGDEIIIVSGTNAGARINKPLTIRGTTSKSGKKAATIGISRKYPSPFVATPAGNKSAGLILETGSAGTVIMDLKFSKVELAIYGEGINEITIQNIEITKPVQGITNWDGSNWLISNNIIKDLQTKGGGGLGIVLGSHDADPLTITLENVLVSNNIYGKLKIDKADLADPFVGAGIALIVEPSAVDPEVALTQGNFNIINLSGRPIENQAGDPLLCGIMFNQREEALLVKCDMHDNAFTDTDFGRTVYKVLEKPDDLESCSNSAPVVTTTLTSLNKAEESSFARNVPLARPF